MRSLSVFALLSTAAALRGLRASHGNATAPAVEPSALAAPAHPPAAASSPPAKAEPSAAKAEKIVTTPVAAVAAKTTVEKPVEKVEKKVEAKPVEAKVEAKPVEKKVEAPKPVEKKVEAKPVAVEKPVEPKAEPKPVEAVAKVEAVVQAVVQTENSTEQANVSGSSGFAADANASLINATDDVDVNPKLLREGKSVEENLKDDMENPKDDAPAKTENHLLATVSAADVYAHVNFMLNRMNEQARERVRIAEQEPEPVKEEAAAPEPVKEEAAVPETVKATPESLDAAPEAQLNDTVPEPVVAAVKAEPKEAKVEEPKEPKVEAKVEPKVEAKVAAKAEEPKPQPAKVEKIEKPKPAPVVHEVRMTEDERRKKNEEDKEAKFPTEWIKNDVKFNVDKDTMKIREDSVEEAVRSQQEWNTKTESWLQAKPKQQAKLLRGQ